MGSGNTNKAEDQAERGGELHRLQDAVVQPRPPASGVVYLLHFDRPYKHAKHYMGYANNLERRIERHVRGDGSKLVKAVVEAGIGFKVAKVWEGTRELERYFKNKKNACKLCPICRGEIK